VNKQIRAELQDMSSWLTFTKVYALRDRQRAIYIQRERKRKRTSEREREKREKDSW
jgi:hypothetical protein